jgi:hypothetical protein
VVAAVVVDLANNLLGLILWQQCLPCNNNRLTLPNKLGALLKLSVRNNRLLQLHSKVRRLLVSN